METIKLFISGAMLLMVVSLSLQAQTNLVTNGNFEQVDANGKPTGWGDTYSKAAGVTAKYDTIDAADFKEGKQSGFFTCNPTLNLEYEYPRLYAYNRVKDLPANKAYDISFWYKSGDMLNKTGDAPALRLSSSRFYNTSNTVENSTKFSAPLDILVGEWLYGEVKGIQSPAVITDFILGFFSANNAYWLDDVQMVESTGTGINDIKANTKLPVYVSEGVLYVGNTTVGDIVTIYSVAGQMLKSEKAENTTTKISGLAPRQVYLVKCGARAAKVIL